MAIVLTRQKQIELDRPETLGGQYGAEIGSGSDRRFDAPPALGTNYFRRDRDSSTKLRCSQSFAAVASEMPPSLRINRDNTPLSKPVAFDRAYSDPLRPMA